MAQYKHREFLMQVSYSAFDTRNAPATIASNPGIYRCPACGEEIVVAKGCRLPPADHHKHTDGQGKVEWQLLVFAEQSR